LTAILVLSNQKDSFTEIKNALHNDYVVLSANSAAKLSENLVDGAVTILVIDAAFLKLGVQEEIAEIVSFFPELILIAAVESGETENLVNLFQKFEIYRYLQKPFSADQVSKCIAAAIRKQSKIASNSPHINDTHNLNKSSRKSSRTYIFPALLLLASLIYILLPNKETTVPSNTSGKVSISPATKIDEGKPDKNTEPDLLTIEHASINLSAKTGINNDSNNIETLTSNKEDELLLEEEKKQNEIKREKFEKLITTINKRMNAGKIISPANDSVKYYLSKLKQDDPENADIDELENIFVKTLISQADTAIKNNQFNLAKTHIEEAKLSNLQKEVISTIEQQLNSSLAKYEQKKLKKEQQARIQNLLSLADNAIEKNELIYPEKSSAKYYLESAKKIEPNNKKTQAKIKTLVNLLLIEIETDILGNTLASANSKLKSTKGFGVKLEEITLLESRINDAVNKQLK
jgi:DNA-binding response OmpR family regulator